MLTHAMKAYKASSAIILRNPEVFLRRTVRREAGFLVLVLDESKPVPQQRAKADAIAQYKVGER